MPIGNEPQYESSRPTLPKNSISNHVAGNVATTSVTLNIDLTPPAIALESRSPVANAAGWNNSPVTVTWTCSDALSGVITPTDSVTLASEGAAQPATGACRDHADHLTSSTLADINIDTTSPTAHITTPADGAVYLLNAVAAQRGEGGPRTSTVAIVSGTWTTGSAAFARGAVPDGSREVSAHDRRRATPK